MDTPSSLLSTRQLVIDVPGRDDAYPLGLTIQQGQIWGILGPNGAGKTTLLHTLAGLRKPRSGNILLAGKALDRWRRRQIAQQLAVIFQERSDSFPSTVLESAMIGRHPFLSTWELESSDDLSIAREALNRMELGNMEQRLVSTLSGGEKQRLAVATALCQQAQLWLADEPGNHLDLHHQVAVMQLLREQADNGCAVVLCLHDINLAARYCSHLLLLYPDGSACWGEASTMLKTEALERLYRQPLRVIQDSGERIFLPRTERPDKPL